MAASRAPRSITERIREDQRHGTDHVTAVMVSRAPLPQVGTVKRRWLRYISDCRDQVMQRCTNEDDAYECDGCPRIFIRRPRVLAHHHVFGRGKLVAEPLASHPDFGAGLCRECHRNVHADPAGPKNQLICIVALQRAWDTFGLEPVKTGDVDIDALNGYARSLERMLKDDGTWAVLLEKAGK